MSLYEYFFIFIKLSSFLSRPFDSNVREIQFNLMYATKEIHWPAELKIPGVWLQEWVDLGAQWTSSGSVLPLLMVLLSLGWCHLRQALPHSGTKGYHNSWHAFLRPWASRKRIASLLRVLAHSWGIGPAWVRSPGHPLMTWPALNSLPWEPWPE